MALFLKMDHFRPLFLYFCLFSLNAQLVDKILPMLGFKLRISGVWSIRSTNWATTTALIKVRLLCVRKNFNLQGGKHSSLTSTTSNAFYSWWSPIQSHILTLRSPNSWMRDTYFNPVHRPELSFLGPNAFARLCVYRKLSGSLCKFRTSCVRTLSLGLFPSSLFSCLLFWSCMLRVSLISSEIITPISKEA